MTIKGEPHNASACPVANYVNMMLDEIGVKGFAMVEKSSVRVFDSHRQFSFKIPLPPAGTQFVLDFDLGKYPELINESNRQPIYGEQLSEV